MRNHIRVIALGKLRASATQCGFIFTGKPENPVAVQYSRLKAQPSQSDTNGLADSWRSICLWSHGKNKESGF